MKFVTGVGVFVALLFSTGAMAADSTSGSSAWCNAYYKFPGQPAQGRHLMCHYPTYDACESAGRGQTNPGNQPWSCVKNPAR